MSVYLSEHTLQGNKNENFHFDIKNLANTEEDNSSILLVVLDPQARIADQAIHLITSSSITVQNNLEFQVR